MILKLRNYIPDSYQKNLNNVDYNKLYDNGYRLILMDLDNTLLGYNETKISEEKIKLIDEIKDVGFTVILVSNNHKKRVKETASILGVKYVKSMKKPFKFGIKKALKIANFTSKETICIGDQLITDIQGGNRMNLYTILVDSIERKKEIFITKINRKIEKRALKKIKKKYPDNYRILEEYDRRYYAK